MVMLPVLNAVQLYICSRVHIVSFPEINKTTHITSSTTVQGCTVLNQGVSGQSSRSGFTKYGHRNSCSSD